MSTADQIKQEITDLKAELQGLEVQRIERDNILRQILDGKAEFAAIQREIGLSEGELKGIQAKKKIEEARKNSEIEERLVKVATREDVSRKTEEKQLKTNNEQATKGAELDRREAKLKEDVAFLAQRQENHAKEEQKLRDAKKLHEKALEEYVYQVAVLVSREKEADQREATIKTREDQHADNLKKIDAEWDKVHTANAMVDSRNRILESRESSAIQKESDLGQIEKSIKVKESELEDREIVIGQKAKENDEKSAKLTEISKDNDLRELEIRTRERALEKRERIIIIKEQEHGGE